MVGFFLNDLKKRGLLHQCTHLEGLEKHLAQPRKVYAGFDPTKDSLTIGNLVSILLLRRFQLAGHQPVVLMGGGTGLIGDPSGKDAERSLNTVETVQKNIAGQREIFSSILDFDGDTAATVVNNHDWIGELSYIDALREIGKHFSVNMMIQKDSVKSRLEGRDQGISYTEFSYMLLQAFDFAHLKESDGVTIQVGGSDQWGNIVAGVELSRRKQLGEVFGLTTPLVTKSDGGKFGKTEDGAIWLTSDKTSAYAFYQFWLNAADDDIGTFLGFFSLKTAEEVQSLIAEHQQNPGARLAQKSLADEMTALIHGEEALQEAKAASQALFSGDVAGLSKKLIEEVFKAVPQAKLSREILEKQIPLVDLLVEVKAVKSKREARQFLAQGAVSLNGQRQKEERSVTTTELLHDQFLLIRKGKKNWNLISFYS